MKDGNMVEGVVNPPSFPNPLLWRHGEAHALGPERADAVRLE